MGLFEEGHRPAAVRGLLTSLSPAQPILPGSREGLSTTHSSCSNGLGPRPASSPTLLCPLCGGRGVASFNQKSFGCKPSGKHEKCRCFALGKISPLSAMLSPQVLPRDLAPDQRSLDFGVRLTWAHTVAPFLSVYVTLDYLLLFLEPQYQLKNG